MFYVYSSVDEANYFHKNVMWSKMHECTRKRKLSRDRGNNVKYAAPRTLSNAKKKKKKHALPARIVGLGESRLGFVGYDGFANRINFVYKWSLCISFMVHTINQTNHFFFLQSIMKIAMSTIFWTLKLTFCFNLNNKTIQKLLICLVFLFYCVRFMTPAFCFSFFINELVHLKNYI